MTSRPQVHVYDANETKKQVGSVALPVVFTAPIRVDIVQRVHTDLNKNRRQVHGVKISKKGTAGMGHSAESWGTGRAVARIPRVGGSGTNRSGQGAFGNQCRKGRMFAPLKTFRRIHRRVNVNQKRHAVASALAASALVPLVLARGHRVSNIQELPYVFDDALENFEKTKQAVAFLKELELTMMFLKLLKPKPQELVKVNLETEDINLEEVLQLFMENENATPTRALRNIPGVDVCNVNRLNLLQLAPGGHVGRFVIWTKSAFVKLNQLFGTYSYTSQVKQGYQLQRPVLANADIARIINSNEIQTVVRQAKETEHHQRKKNPLKNKNSLFRLNPAAKISKEKPEKLTKPTEPKEHKLLNKKENKPEPQKKDLKLGLESSTMLTNKPLTELNKTKQTLQLKEKNSKKKKTNECIYMAFLIYIIVILFQKYFCQFFKVKQKNTGIMFFIFTCL
ncbi:hypothetical protein IMG5_201070 [Ichthyophthirius multifiliis]|uniref:Large ribosomal subunit protein uL4 C-terminal domain-containing protein n=1 Tax=Ichthyophthirius multifiliis TaxID=5932 RepID=G0R5U5_ICHMU|nr:hypothetical protein IMG5_201070 [Ichthyophthirius multifiliis]EGR27166.1 hypothetical protein IMG5_201070 [Ichthyophthirius multifiliis]|eukprot:XP_004024050.1 hypothetical protein IMG5_201070 [Ichthyophthirius multifiliis]